MVGGRSSLHEEEEKVEGHEEEEGRLLVMDQRRTFLSTNEAEVIQSS